MGGKKDGIDENTHTHTHTHTHTRLYDIYDIAARKHKMEACSSMWNWTPGYISILQFFF